MNGSVYVYNLLIVEDEEIQRKNLRIMLQELGDQYKIFEAGNVNDAMKILNCNDIDLFYLDQNLPDASGLELGRKIRQIDKYQFTWIVFITSHVQYMVEAFKDIHCYDYILKPIEKRDIQRLSKDLLRNLKSIEIQDTEKEHLFVNIDGIIAKIFVKDIFFIETFRKTTTIHTSIGKYEIKWFSMSKILNLLNSQKIIQSHKSYAVNFEYILNIDKRLSCWQIKFNGYNEMALMGDKYKTEVLRLLNNCSSAEVKKCMG